MTKLLETPVPPRSDQPQPGDRYGNLTYLGEAGHNGRFRLWKMRCVCGTVEIKAAYFVYTWKTHRCTRCAFPNGNNGKGGRKPRAKM